LLLRFSATHLSMQGMRKKSTKHVETTSLFGRCTLPEEH